METEDWAERPDGSVRIDATIYVARLQGNRDRRRRHPHPRDRQAGAGELVRLCHLFLNVKERAGWDEEGARLRVIGLEVPKE